MAMGFKKPKTRLLVQLRTWETFTNFALFHLRRNFICSASFLQIYALTKNINQTWPTIII